MTVPVSWRGQVVESLCWYGGQIRAVATGVVHPIRRTVHGLIDDSGPAVVELVATQEQLLLGIPPAETTGRRRRRARSAA
ncbi:MAG: hypothetical protein ACRDTP_04595 [Mycobacteriales bacterium]